MAKAPTRALILAIKGCPVLRLDRIPDILSDLAIPHGIGEPNLLFRGRVTLYFNQLSFTKILRSQVFSWSWHRYTWCEESIDWFQVELFSAVTSSLTNNRPGHYQVATALVVGLWCTLYNEFWNGEQVTVSHIPTLQTPTLTVPASSPPSGILQFSGGDCHQMGN